MLCELCLRVLQVLVIIRTSYSFNVEERNPIVKRAEAKEKGSYFGFSVAQHWMTDKPKNLNDIKILIGAPLGLNRQPDVKKSGALFQCPITNNAYDCIQVETDGKRLDSFDYDDPLVRDVVPLEPPGPDEIKEGQWLGVTVKSHKPGGKVVVCAHRYIQSPNLRLHHYGLGLCYLLSNRLEAEESLQPCKGRPMEKLHQQYGFCQVGTSLAITDNGYALMGSPGPYTWRGTVFAHHVGLDNFEWLNKDQQIYRGPLNDQPQPIGKYSYVGMSVAGGNFFRTGRISYASGAPRSELVGQVFFFEMTQGVEVMNITYTLTGEQFASSFGYEILALDVDKDGYDDLLVGAPFHYSEESGGAVYIYTNLRKCLPSIQGCNHTLVLNGRKESRFGFSMTSLGDINRDSYVDIAIGAPYEDGEGAVYIYLGSGDGFGRAPSQVIRARHLKTLGYSLSGGLDMDLNGYPDLLVGAYESDMAVLFKTRPIIDIGIEVRGSELANINATKKGCGYNSSSDAACFSFETCFRLSEFKSAGGFQVKYQIEEVPIKIARIWFRNPDLADKRDSSNLKYVEVDDVSREYCQFETVNIKEGISDILSPIQFKVNFTLENNEVDSPILNKTSVKEFKATFQKSCGSDDVCESRLELSAGTQLKKSDEGYIMDLGQNVEFLLDANVTNRGESAYEAKLFVNHPEALSYIALLTDKNKTNNVICSVISDTMVSCNLGNPFQEHQSVNLRLRFEVKNTKEQRIKLRVHVNSTSTELSTKTRSSFKLVLQKIANYAITGKAITPHLIYAGEVKGEAAMRHLEDIGARVYHTYEVANHGQWNIQDMKIRIHWPYQVFSEREEGGKWLLYLEDRPRIDLEPINSCTVDPLSAVNPLALNSSGLDAEAPANFTGPIAFNDAPGGERAGRLRRDAGDVVAPEARTGKDGRARNVVTMDCTKSARCALITCKVKQLNRNDRVRVQIYSRLWNSTLVEDYSGVDWVSLKSAAEVVIEDATIISSNDAIRQIGIETLAYPSIVAVDAGLSLWIIIGSVVAGLLVLLILIFILYKVGFFKRNRVNDQTLSGNLKKQGGESQGLLGEKEGK